MRRVHKNNNNKRGRRGRPEGHTQTQGRSAGEKKRGPSFRWEFLRDACELEKVKMEKEN